MLPFGDLLGCGRSVSNDVSLHSLFGHEVLKTRLFAVSDCQHSQDDLQGDNG